MDNHDLQRGCAFYVTAFFVVLVVLPTMCIQKAVHQAKTIKADFNLRESEIELVAVEEKYAFVRSQPDGLSAVACLGHLAAQPLADVDGRTLHAVRPEYRAPDPWPTPQYVWVRRYEDGDAAYRAVYTVFRTRSQVEQWVRQNGYEGQFQFSLFTVVKEQHNSDAYAVVNYPSYHKWACPSTLQTVIFTRAAKYAVVDGEARPSGPNDEMYSLYRRLAR